MTPDDRQADSHRAWSGAGGPSESVLANAAPRRGVGRRIWRGYTVLAVQMCTVLLLLALVNLVAWSVLRVREQRTQRLPPTLTALESRFGPAWVSTLYPGFDQSKLQQLYDEWTRLSFDYEPFTQFKVHPMQGVYTNVSEHGFRSNGEAAPWPPDPARFNVFVFGSSTAFGTMLPDAQTIPAALHTLLRSAGCAAAQVYNFARPGYISAQERVLFEQLLLANAVPQVAIFFDGMSDSVWQGTDPQFTDRLTDMVDKINTEKASSRSVSSRWYARARELVAGLPMTSVAELLIERFSHRGAVAPFAGVVGAHADPENQLRRWIANKRMQDALADQFGVKILTVWQPSPTFHYDLSNHAFAQSLIQWGLPAHSVLEQSKAFYGEMDERRHDPAVERGLLWLGDMQLARPENLYVDSLHYTAAFSRDIAAAIADEMQRHGWLACTIAASDSAH